MWKEADEAEWKELMQKHVQCVQRRYSRTCSGLPETSDTTNTHTYTAKVMYELVMNYSTDTPDKAVILCL